MVHTVCGCGRRGLVVGQGPTGSAQPAALFRQLVATVEPCYALGTTLFKGGLERCRRRLVTSALAPKDGNTGDTRCQEFLAAALDPEHRAMPLDRPRRKSCKPLVRRQRQNEPTAIGKAIEPNVGWPRRSGIDVDDIGSVELHPRAIAVDTSDVSLSFAVCRQLGGKGGIIFDRGYPPAAPHQMRQNCGV